MKILVVSDSHGRYDRLGTLMSMHADADEILFLGDGVRDLDALADDLPVRAVRGNCDLFGSGDLPTERLEELGGKRFFLTHGHRYGVKYSLEAAIAAFHPPVAGARVADIGASTGGFTDCLLQNGAACVYAVDAGHGQLHPRLRADCRVRVAEGLNARAITPADLSRMEDEWRAAHADPPSDFVGTVDGCVMDVSFISAKYIIEPLFACLADGADFICLIKPQFEVGRGGVGKGGIVKDDKLRMNAVRGVVEFATGCGFTHLGLIQSSIKGGDGNIEFLAHFRK